MKAKTGSTRYPPMISSTGGNGGVATRLDQGARFQSTRGGSNCVIGIFRPPGTKIDSANGISSHPHENQTRGAVEGQKEEEKSLPDERVSTSLSRLGAFFPAKHISLGTSYDVSGASVSKLWGDPEDVALSEAPLHQGSTDCKGRKNPGQYTP